MKDAEDNTYRSLKHFVVYFFTLYFLFRGMIGFVSDLFYPLESFPFWFGGITGVVLFIIYLKRDVSI